MKKPAQMKEYIIVTPHPQLPRHMKGGQSFEEVRQMMALGEAWKRAAHRNKLQLLAREIEQKVIAKHGGAILTSGAGYGIEGNPEQFIDTLRVRTTAAGLKALKQIGEVGRISEAIDFTRLLDVPDGQTNVPKGLCWTNPKFR